MGHASAEGYVDGVHILVGDRHRELILQPLDMRSTRPDPGPRGPDETKGESGLVSTLDDLRKWDRALGANTLVRAETLANALMPAKVDEGESTYAFGWNVVARDGDTCMWHTGNANGRRAFIGRLVREGTTVIILTRGNSRRLEIADAIVNILHGRPYRSAAALDRAARPDDPGDERARRRARGV